MNYTKHLIASGTSIKSALSQLNELAQDAILFVVDSEKRLVGSLSDGDVRRGLINNLTMESPVDDFVYRKPRYLKQGSYSFENVKEIRSAGVQIVPLIDQNNSVINVVNFRFLRSYLPIDAMIMAGGRGERLRPLTDTVPKPLLQVGDKPIIDHHIDRLISYGIDTIHFSLGYKGDMLKSHLEKKKPENVAMHYVFEDTPLGTIGAASKINNFHNDTILLTNSDLLTNLNYEQFYEEFVSKGADLMIATTSYEVKVPYAVMETNDTKVVSFKEKPTYTFQSNSGIYLMKRSLLELIPQNKFYNATDLISEAIEQKKSVMYFPIIGYWLDIGKPNDYEKAQRDIKHIQF
jgi:dTDP-glucose pyrophosphorylase